MAYLLCWFSSLATAFAVSLQAPPSFPEAERAIVGGEEGSGNVTEERTVACGAPLEDGVGEELESLGLAWPQNCSRGGRRPRERPVIWIHLHKAAGSTMCALAKLNDEAVVFPQANCNWKPFDDMGGRGVSCERREAFFRQSNYTWGAVERVLRDEDFCPNFDYALLLRDPTELAVSAIKFHRYTVSDVYKSMACVRNGDCRKSVTGVGGREFKGGRFTIFLWYYMDNFVVRTLGGMEARTAPPGQLQERHFEKAREVLNRASVTMTLEDLGSASGLLRAFGWANVPDVHKNPTDPHPHFGPEDAEEMRRLNRFDYRLYDYVRSVRMPDRVRPLW